MGPDDARRITRRRVPRAFRRLPHPGMDRTAALAAEHRRLSAVLTLAVRETPAVRWAVYDLADIEAELAALSAPIERPWFTG